MDTPLSHSICIALSLSVCIVCLTHTLSLSLVVIRSINSPSIKPHLALPFPLLNLPCQITSLSLISCYNHHNHPAPTCTPDSGPGMEVGGGGR